jgi:hypothetical protein
MGLVYDIASSGEVLAPGSSVYNVAPRLNKAVVAKVSALTIKHEQETRLTYVKGSRGTGRVSQGLH